jgi:hypothetical protein
MLFRRRCARRVSAFLLLVCWAAAQEPGNADGPTSVPLEEAAADSRAAPAPDIQGDAILENRTTLNLLGEADTQAGESRRNENRQINLVDNNAARELIQRVGTTATIVDEFQPELGYFSAEFGIPPRRPIHARAQNGAAVHGNLFWNHDNSVFRARSFFQVGGVKPARANEYGGSVGAGLWEGAFLSLSGSQSKIRGNVNGNVLIPLREERAPLTNDPVLRPIVQRILDAYPDVAPNRPDIADRALNTNSVQAINTDIASAQLTQRRAARDTFAFQYAFTAQDVKAFQLIVGQNPDTANKSHTARITWNRVWGPNTVTDVTAGFDRQGTLLLPAEGALGPLNTVGITGLGPPPIVPLDRAQNRFRYGLSIRNQRSRHSLAAGVNLVRFQFNGDEPDAARGILIFAPDFGRDGIANLRLGTPTRYIRTVGSFYRGFRNWELQAFLGDRWQATSSLSLSFGVQYEPMTRPNDVTGRSDLLFDSDANNVGGTFGFAYRFPNEMGILRGAYGLMYGQIFPPTYGVDRLNLPHVVELNIQTPYLPDPLRDFDLSDLGPNPRSSIYRISPDLSTPYSHQYNLSWEGEIGLGWRLHAGYVGSRSHKLFSTYIRNRAVYAGGIPFNTATVNERRPDQSVYEYLDVHNGSRGYYDAGVLTLTVPAWRGLSFNASYWFSKAIDLGTDYTNTGGGAGSGRRTAGQDGFDVHGDMKGLSDFDQPHAFLLQATYNLSRGGGGRLRQVYRNWNLSAVMLLKNGTPFTVDSGSDGIGVGNLDGQGGDRPMLLDPSVWGRTIGDPDTSQRLLPRSAFRYIRAPAETRGDLGRNTFRKGKLANLNAALARTFVLPHDWQMTLRAESVNFFNTPQFAEPGFSLAAQNFAQITNTLNDGRTFEFSLRLAF